MILVYSSISTGVPAWPSTIFSASRLSDWLQLQTRLLESLEFRSELLPSFFFSSGAIALRRDWTFIPYFV